MPFYAVCSSCHHFAQFSHVQRVSTGSPFRNPEALSSSDSDSWCVLCLMIIMMIIYLLYILCCNLARRKRALLIYVALCRVLFRNLQLSNCCCFWLFRFLSPGDLSSSDNTGSLGSNRHQLPEGFGEAVPSFSFPPDRLVSYLQTLTALSNSKFCHCISSFY